MRERPGSAARTLLGGDERVHVFDSPKKAREYESKIPGARVAFAEEWGWSGVVRLVKDGLWARHVRDREIVLHCETGVLEPTKRQMRSIAALMYERGAAKVFGLEGVGDPRPIPEASQGALFR